MTDLQNLPGTAPPPPPAAPVPAAMAPGLYLRKRREAAGLSLDTVARMLCLETEAAPKAKAAQMANFQNQLRLIEADELGALRPQFHGALVDRLTRFFTFDPAVYQALLAHRADPALPVPLVCGGCACSEADACVDGRYGACAWAETTPGAPPQCTHCQLGLRREVPHAA